MAKMTIKENKFEVEVHIRTLGIVRGTGGEGKTAKTGPIETNIVRKSRGISPFWDLGKQSRAD